MNSKTTFLGLLVLAGLLAPSAEAQSSPANENPFTLSLEARVDASGTRVTLQVGAPNGEPLPSIAEQIRVRFPDRMENIGRAALTEGRWTRIFEAVMDGTPIQAQVLLKGADSRETYVLRAETAAVPASTVPSRYVAQYFRQEGFQSYTRTDAEGRVLTSTTDGRREFVHLTGFVDAPMSWPMDFSVRLLADGDLVVEADRTGLMPTHSYLEGDVLVELYSEWLPESESVLTVSTRTSASGVSAEFNVTRYAADYVWVEDYDGAITSGAEKSGRFVEAVEEIRCLGRLSSGLGQAGGWTPSVPIFRLTSDEISPGGIDDYILWQAVDVGSFPE